MGFAQAAVSFQRLRVAIDQVRAIHGKSLI